MASIIELIKNIRNARLGKDVRESIASAIEQTYEDASKDGNANMEVAQARGTYETLKKRLDNSDSSKADKIELQNEVSSRQTADSELQRQIEVEKARIDNITNLPEGSTTGDAELIDARLGADNVQYSSLGTANRTQFRNINSKLNISSELIDGTYLNYKTGFIVENSQINTKTIIIPISENMKLKYNYTTSTLDARGLGFYDIYDNFLAGYQSINENQIINIPEEATTLKATVSSADDIIMENISNTILNNNSKIIDLYNKDYKNLKLNINNYNYYEHHYAFHGQNRITEYNVGNTNVIEFDVIPNEKLLYKYLNKQPNVIGLHFLDKEDNYISGYQANQNIQIITIPENAKKVRATVHNPYEICYYKDTVDNVSKYLLKLYKNDLNYPIQKLTDNTGFLDIFLNVGCIGDSLASGESVSNEQGQTSNHDLYNYSWGQYLARKTGNQYYNWSKGGLTAKAWLNSIYATECFDGQHLCEAYIIGLGQNDANQNLTIGSSSDIDLNNYNNNADSFYGNYGKIIQKIKEKQPKAKIFVITDMYTGTDQKGYNVAIRAMAEIFDNVYVIDLRKYGMDYYNSELFLAQRRSGHYNAIGYKICAMMIANYIDWIIKNDYDEFKQVEFIGTNYSWNG